ncbi:MAG: M4 family metallopeptidase, partial [Bacteroidota bacterium]
MNTARIGTEYYLIDASRPMYVPPIGQERGVIATWDAQCDTVGHAYGSLTRVKDPNSDNNFNDNAQLRAAVDAHYYTGVVYDYYKNVHSRNSLDNNGRTLRNVVHYMNRYNNAFWNGYFMTYGDGDGVTFGNLAGALDIIGHEMTHGVIEATANLLYENQTGALNESYADVFGTFCEFYARGQAGNWLIGEDIYTPGISGDAMRSMQDPHSGTDWQPSHMSEYVELLNNGSNDLGGVHINSGIPNRGCYIIASTIGVQKTERIYYRALTMYLTNAAQFVDARNATLQAAADLYGRSSSEYTAVESAFTALGVTSDDARELVYDDGYTTGATAWLTLGAMTAVRMTPPATPAKILKLEYFIAGTYGGSRSFIVHILKDSSGAPGSDLIYPFRVTPAVDGWFVVNMSNYISSYHTITNGDFFVAMEYDG